MYSKNGHIRILLIEDNKDDEDLIKDTLKRTGGYVPIIHRVETEAALLLAIDRERWDLVLCDYLLPHFKAERALTLCREKLGDIPFIILSGYEDEETAIRLLKAGAHDFVYKTNLSRLAVAVRRELLQAGERMSGRLEIEKSYIETVEAFGVFLDLRDNNTLNHTVRVTDLTLRLARALRVSGSQFRAIHYGALLHDIGKIGIPDMVLLKPEPLDPGERKIIEMHPQLAYERLAHIDFLKEAITIPYSHHEKFDGTGYPRGLKGEEIPIEARIFSVCDVYDALTNERPYRKPWSKEKAIEYIKSEKGKSFDPEIVDKFIEVIR